MPIVFCSIQCPPSTLSAEETHVYATTLDDPARFQPLLTVDEQERAARFRLARVRDQFIIARGQLRAILAHYLGQDPQAIPILYADGGKPYLACDPVLHFNVSHSDGLAVFAVGHTRVGVDVERDRPVADADNLVNRFFSRRECDEYQALSPHDRPAAFLRAWTRKEAVLKAIGRGAQSLDCCEVTFAEGNAPSLRRLDADLNAGERWELSAWQPAPGYVAAIAIERQ
jgi:4'-phosphopantetheinyl transferase